MRYTVILLSTLTLAFVGGWFASYHYHGFYCGDGQCLDFKKLPPGLYDKLDDHWREFHGNFVERRLGDGKRRVIWVHNMPYGTPRAFERRPEGDYQLHPTEKP